MQAKEVDQLFAQIRRNRRFSEGSDPFRTIHEGIPGSGNPQPQGWYSSHGFSSFVGQTNLLTDPTLETVSSTLTAIGTTKTTNGSWAAHYVLNSGSLTSVQIDRIYDRGNSSAFNPFNSAVIVLSVVVPATTACNADVYFYPDTDWSGVTANPPLDWLIGAVRLFNGGTVIQQPSVATAVLELYNATGSAVEATSLRTVNLLTDFSDLEAQIPLDVFATDVGTDNFRWRLKFHVETTNGLAQSATATCYVAEPTLHFNFQPEALPYAPQLGSWSPNLSTFSAASFTGTIHLTGVISPSQITGNTNNWNPTGLSTANLIRFTTDADGYNLTGITAQGSGRLIWLVNVGSFNLVLQYNDANSSAGNRFIDDTLTLNTPTTMGGGFVSAVLMWYDGTSSGWRFLSTN